MILSPKNYALLIESTEKMTRVLVLRGLPLEAENLARLTKVLQIMRERDKPDTEEPDHLKLLHDRSSRATLDEVLTKMKGN